MKIIQPARENPDELDGYSSPAREVNLEIPDTAEKCARVLRIGRNDFDIRKLASTGKTMHVVRKG